MHSRLWVGDGWVPLYRCTRHELARCDIFRRNPLLLFASIRHRLLEPLCLSAAFRIVHVYL